MSQRDVVIGLLRSRRTHGVDNHVLIYNHGITRAAAIIHELRQEGWDIETTDGPKLNDGRVALCTYTLRAEAGATQQPAGPTNRELAQAAAQRAVLELPAPAPLRLPCGCTRAADGRSWTERCQKHAA